MAHMTKSESQGAALLWAVVLLLSLVSCAPEPGPFEEPLPPRREPLDASEDMQQKETLCTSSPDPSGRVVLSLTHPVRLLTQRPAEQLFYDYGAQYMFIDDHCHVIAYDAERAPNLASASHMRGVLSQRVADQILERMRWAEWPEAADSSLLTEPVNPDDPPSTRVDEGLDVRALGRRYQAACSRCESEELAIALHIQRTLGIVLTSISEDLPQQLAYYAVRVEPDQEEEEHRYYVFLPEYTRLQTEPEERLTRLAPGQARQLDEVEVISALWKMRRILMSSGEWEDDLVAAVINGDDSYVHYHVYLRTVVPELERSSR